jgi:hypothetical protein
MNGQVFDQARHTASSAAAAAVQRVAPVIDSAPLPPQAKDMARQVAGAAQSPPQTTGVGASASAGSAGEGQNATTGQPSSLGSTGSTDHDRQREYIGTPGIESASGRDRTTDELPPDLGRP